VLLEFAARARLYADWDRKLRGRTRFFGAAAVTNAALVELCSLKGSQRLLGNAAGGLLSAVGRRLERLNTECAKRIERGSLRDRDLDRLLIVMEQTTVERVLQQNVQLAPNCNEQAVEQINRLLSWVERWAWLSGRWPNGCIYSDVLRQVRDELGRQPDFAVLGDRVGIGQALIRSLP
jgi:hypothetical protein